MLDKKFFISPSECIMRFEVADGSMWIVAVGSIVSGAEGTTLKGGVYRVSSMSGCVELVSRPTIAFSVFNPIEACVVSMGIAYGA